MKRAVWFLSAAVAMVVLAGGCASTAGDGADKPRPEVMSGMGHEEAEKLAADYIAGFVASLKENDFDKLKAVIPADSSASFIFTLLAVEALAKTKSGSADSKSSRLGE